MGWAVASLHFFAVLMLFVLRSQREPEGAAGEVKAPWTTAAARAEKRRVTVENTINGNLDLPFTPSADGR